MRGKPFNQIISSLGQHCAVTKFIEHFHIDSRMVEPGGLFFAVKGERFDGHDFLGEVAQKGAVGAVVDQSYVGPDFGLELVKVENVTSALQQLAKEAFKLRREKVVAITGSMGKTTTKEFTAQLLSEKFKVGKTPGNYNTQLTLPLTILNFKEEYDVLVLEMGMGDHGQISKLVDIAPPDIAVVTKIAPAGMEDFRGGLEAISRAKGEIFSHEKTQLGITSAQAASFPAVLYGGRMPKWIYGWKKDLADPRGADFVMEKRGDCVVVNDSPPLPLSFEGDHIKENFLAAVAISRALGLSWNEIGRGAPKCTPYRLRFQKKEIDGVTFICDCYNANPESVKAALDNLPKPASSCKVIGVLGMMPDLGEESSRYHQHIGEYASATLDELLSIGKYADQMAHAFSSSGKKAHHFAEMSEIKRELYAKIKPGDVVLIKGANSLNLWELL